MSLTVFAIVLGALFGLSIAVGLRRRSAVTQPVCGHCGYFVRGLTTFFCPECGSDLREVGIIRPPRRILSPTGRATATPGAAQQTATAEHPG